MGLATIDPHSQKEHTEIHKIPGVYKTWTGSDRIGLTKPGPDRIGLTKPGSDCVRLTKPGPDPKKNRIAINFRQNSHETSHDQVLA